MLARPDHRSTGSFLSLARGLGLGLAALAAGGVAHTAGAVRVTADAGPGCRAAAAEIQGVKIDPTSDEWAGKTVNLDGLAHAPRDGSPYLGWDDAPVVVNLFTDFQCPVCRRSADPVKQLVADFPEKVKVVFRNNALSMHRRAEPAAAAALAAGRQGKFWEYHDRLFANPQGLDDGLLERVARDLGLDVERWRRDRNDPEILGRIRRETEAAVRLGAPGTPGLFVNGIRQVGWGSYRDLKEKVGREVAAAAVLAERGTPVADLAEQRIRAMVDANPSREDEGPRDADEWVRVLLAD